MHRHAETSLHCDTKNIMKNTFCVLLSALSLYPVAAKSQQTPQQLVRMNVGSVQGVTPGYKATAGSGLTLNLAAGTAFCGGNIQSYAGGTLTMAPSATNYVYLDPSANCAPASNTSGFTAAAIPIATVLTGSYAVTTVTDNRTMFTGTGGSGVGTCAANQFVTAVNSGSPTCAQPAFSNLVGAALPAQLPSATGGAQGAIQLIGDLGGTSSTPKVTGIQGIPVSSTAPSNGQVHQYNSGSNQWVPTTLPSGTVTSVGLSTPNWLSVSGSPITTGGTLAVTAASGQTANQFLATPNGASGAVSLRTIGPADLPPASSTTEGILQLIGDLGGTASSPKVAGIQGNPVTVATPTANQILQWNGSAWSPASLPATVVAGSCSSNQFVTALSASSAPTCASAVTASTATANQFATGISAAGSLSYAQPSFANLSGTATGAQLPSATGAAQGAIQLAGDFGGTSSVPKVTGIQGIPVSSTLPTNGQVHQFNSSLNQWVPTTLPTGATVQVNGTNASNQATINFQNGTNISVANPTAGNISISLSGTIPASSLPAPTASTLGGVQSYAAVSHQWVNSISASGVPSGSQPSFSDITGTAADVQLASAYSGVGSCAANSFASTLNRNGAPTCTSAVTVSTAPAHQFATAVSAAGALTYTQPAFADISGSIASGQLPGATNLAIGALQLTGDLGGSASAPKVAALQGHTLSSTAPAANQVLAWNGSAWAPATPSSGTVTSVALSAPAEFTVSGSPVTNSGTLTLTKANQTANLVYAGPSSGVAAAPTFRSLAAADIPAATAVAPGAVQLAGDIGGTAASPQVVSTHLASALSLAQGGTGQTTAGGAFNALAPATAKGGLIVGTGANAYGNVALGTSGQCLTSNGTTVAWGACGSGGGTPGGSNTQFQFNNSGAFGGASNVTYASGTGVLTMSQVANGNDTLFGSRFTDTSPTGNLIHFQNAAKTTDLFKVDASGNVTATSFSSTTTGPFVFSGAEGTCTGAVAGKDVLCLGDTTTHTVQSSLNGGAFVPIPQLAGDFGGTAASPQVVSTHLTSALSLAQGGTGQTTAGGAFNALAPATAKGGLIVGTGANAYGNVALGSSGQCLTSNGTTVAWGACGSGGGTPGGSNTQLEFNNSGAFGGASNVTYASGTGVLTVNQVANGNDTFFGARFTDTSPTGNLIHFQNAAKTGDLFKVDASGNVIATSFTSTTTGPFVFSGTEGTCTGAIAGKDVLCLGDSTSHTAQLSLNGGAFTSIPQLAGDLGNTAASPQVVNTHLPNTTAAIGGAAIAAQSCSDTSVSVAAATTSMNVLAQPAGALGSNWSNITWEAYVSAAGTVKVHLCNLTASSVTPASMTFNVRVVD